MGTKMAKAVSQMNEENKLRPDEIVTNFMGGDSYKLNPLDTLKLVSASSIFGEASYYRKDVKDGKFSWQREYTDPAMYAIFSSMAGKSTTEVFTETIDAALDYDFGGTLDFAIELRKQFNMRLNPQVIMQSIQNVQNSVVKILESLLMLKDSLCLVLMSQCLSLLITCFLTKVRKTTFLQF